MIKTLDKAAMRLLRIQIDKDLEALSELHGIKLSLGNGSFNGANGRFELIVATKQEDGMELTKEAVNFKQHAQRYGLMPGDLGREFISGAGRRFILIGLNPGRPKFPIQAKCLDDNKTYKFTEMSVKVALAAQR